MKGYTNNDIVGNSHKNYILDCSILDYRYIYEIKGDKAEVFVTDILKKNKFPEIDGENFIAESIVWNYLGSKYSMRWVNEIIYICNYLEDGLTNKSLFLRVKNVHGTLLLYKSNLKYDIPYKFKIKNSINYYRFLFLSKLSRKEYFIRKASLVNIIGIVFGFFISIVDKYNLKTN